MANTIEQAKIEPNDAIGPSITHLLEPGEQIVWQGHPAGSDIKPRQLMRTSTTTPPPISKDWLTVLATVLTLMGISAIVAYILLSQTIPMSQTIPSGLTITGCGLFAMLLIVVLAGLLSGVHPYAKPDDNYWLTTKHAIIMRKRSNKNTYATTIIDLATTDTVKLIDMGEGHGTLIFGRDATYMYSRAAGRYVSNEQDYSFSNVANVVELYQLVRETQAAARRSNP